MIWYLWDPWDLFGASDEKLSVGGSGVGNVS